MLSTHIVIAEVAKPQGVRGELKLRPITQDIYRFDGLKKIYLKQGEEYVLEAASTEFHDYEYSGKEYAGDDPMWRCGLMDENGNTIADCIYTGVRILSREEIWLEEPDGDWVSFKWME